MKRISKIIRLNKWLMDAKEMRNFEHYRDLVLKIHKMEIEDRVPIGTYVIRR